MWINLQVHLLHPPAPEQYHPHPRQGPSRLRRRVRRAEARSKAAGKATQKSTVEVSVQTDDDQIKTMDAAVQVESQDHVLPNHAPHLPVHPFPPPQHLLDEVCHDQLYAAAVQAEHHPQQSHVPPNIPQIDGAMLSPVVEDETQIWSCKCCSFQRFFKTEDELQQHHNSLDDRGLQHMLRYDECNICYPWHVWS